MEREHAQVGGPRGPAARIESKFNVSYGDLWALDGHRLAVADSADPAALDALLEGRPVDLLLADPPYGTRYHAVAARRSVRKYGQLVLSRKSDIASDHGAGSAARAILRTLEAAYPRMRGGCAFYLFTASASLEQVLGAMRQAGLPMRHTLVWVKNTVAMTRSDYMYRHELVLYGWKAGGARYWDGTRPCSAPGYAPPVAGSRKGELWEAIWRYQRLLNGASDVQEARSVKRCVYHPTMKPLDLLEGFVRRSCPAGGLVLDPFGGSCGTLLACQSQGRVGRAVEIDPEFASLALQRYRDAHPGAAIRCLGRLQGGQDRVGDADAQGVVGHGG